MGLLHNFSGFTEVSGTLSWTWHICHLRDSATRQDRSSEDRQAGRGQNGRAKPAWPAPREAEGLHVGGGKDT